MYRDYCSKRSIRQFLYLMLPYKERTADDFTKYADNYAYSKSVLPLVDNKHTAVETIRRVSTSWTVIYSSLQWININFKANF